MARAIRIETREQTQAVAGALARGCRDLLQAAPEANVFIGLAGDLGAGKTTFVQGFVEALAPGEGRQVTSPTFALVQRYPTAPPVTHLDLYRLSGLDELEAIGFRELYHDPGVTLVEWAERVPEALPASRLDVRLGVAAPPAPDEHRDLEVRAHGARLEALLKGALP